MLHATLWLKVMAGLTLYPRVKDWEVPHKIWTRQECPFHHCYSTLYWKFYPEQLEKEKK